MLFSLFLGESIITVIPSNVMVGDQVEITCSFIITSNGPRTITLRNRDRQLVRKYRKDFHIILHSKGSKCASITYVIQKATLAEAGVYKCEATGNDESMQYEGSTYNLTVSSKFLFKCIVLTCSASCHILYGKSDY